jgi:hypothetical protein
MAKIPPQQLSDKTKRQLKRVVDRDAQNKTQKLGSADIDEIGTIRHVRLVRCQPNSICATYPDPGANKFPIRMGEMTWDNTECGYEAPEWKLYEPKDSYDRIAIDLDRTYHKEDSYAEVFLFHGQWYFVKSSNAEMIRFTIVSVNLAAFTAVVTVTSRTCPLTVVSEEVSGQVTVHDPCECFLDEPEADLIGRCGTAVYMLPDGGDDCQWEIWHLCCPPPE